MVVGLGENGEGGRGRERVGTVMHTSSAPCHPAGKKRGKRRKKKQKKVIEVGGGGGRDASHRDGLTGWFTIEGPMQSMHHHAASS